ncbi:MAG TPA: hypothetical protein VHO69_09175, partial [Phototrophicaceae bacterium]|nr:hypothetical protein [Phototrophicaceae bacterium]
MLKQAPLWRIRWLLLAGLLLLNLPQMTLALPGDIQTPYLAWQPDGEILAVASGDSVRLVDAASGKILNNLSGLAEQKAEPSWSPDGRQLAIVNDYDVEIWATPWDAQLAQRSIVYQFYARAAKSQPRPSIMSVAWSPDGS